MLDLAYDFFNKELFEGKLPGCLITIQRKSKARGYFCPERFETRGESKYALHEIALNPQHFNDRSDTEIISTLVHEMVHLWQEEMGQHPPRRGYHNREWGTKMEEIGLIPSNNEEEGGRKTGQSMSHYIEQGGKFSRLITTFFANNSAIEYQDRPLMDIKKAKAKNKVKYFCPTCLAKVWGKPAMKIICGEDQALMLDANE